MTSTDPDRARSRFINAVNRFIEGAGLERNRVINAAAQAPRLLQGTTDEVVNLTGLPSNDLDYYIYELGRLQDAAREIVKVFDEPREVIAALAAFDAAVPSLREARNPLTHASDDARMDDVGWFSAVVRLRANGDIEYLVDPRYADHDAAEALAAALLDFLRTGLRS